MTRPDSPRLFRVLLSARDLALARRFYTRLLGARGRAVAGDRIYFDCGTVILGIVAAPRSGTKAAPPSAEATYFSVRDLDAVYRRAARLRGLSPDFIHGDPAEPAGAIRRRPWGERSFYARDPSGNSLCFVEAKTKFTGTRSQVAALRAEPGSISSGPRRGEADERSAEPSGPRRRAPPPPRVLNPRGSPGGKQTTRARNLR